MEANSGESLQMSCVLFLMVLFFRLMVFSFFWDWNIVHTPKIVKTLKNVKFRMSKTIDCSRVNTEMIYAIIALTVGPMRASVNPVLN